MRKIALFPVKRLHIYAVVSVLFAATVQPAGAQLRYKVTSLGLRSETSFAPAPQANGSVQNVFASLANENDAIAGGLPQGETSVAAVLQAGTISIIPGLHNAQRSVLAGINNAGHVVGVFEDNFVRHGFYYDGNVMLDLNDLLVTIPPNTPSTTIRQSVATALNRHGHVVGQATAKVIYNGQTNYPLQAFVYRNGAIQTLGSWVASSNAGWAYSWANDINDNGDIVGWAYGDFTNDCSNGGVIDHAFLYRNGQLQDIGALIPFPNVSVALAVNNNLQVIGHFTSCEPSLSTGFLYHDGAVTVLTNSDGTYFLPTAINDAGEIVGYGNEAGIFRNGVYHSLEDSVDQSTGWRFFYPYWIKENGEIIVSAHFIPGGEEHLAFLTPVGPLLITESPQNSLVFQGGIARFAATASGVGAVGYQWQFNEADLPNQTNSTLLITNATAASAGSYRVIVKDSAGDEISPNASLHMFSFGIAENQARITTTGPEGARIRVEYSSNLIDWFELSTTGTGGEQIISDPEPLTQPHRFYRTTLLE